MEFDTPGNDPDPKVATVPFTRSRFDRSTGTKNPRQQVNLLSSYVDAANVYGASCDRALALRALDGTCSFVVIRALAGLGRFFQERIGNAAVATSTDVAFEPYGFLRLERVRSCSIYCCELS